MQPEVKIQKINFLLRYLCFKLLRLHQETGVPTAADAQQLVSTIFQNGESELRTDEMKRFFFGAYQDLDDIIGFLKSVGLVDFRKQTSLGLKDIRKAYFFDPGRRSENRAGTGQRAGGLLVFQPLRAN